MYIGEGLRRMRQDKGLTLLDLAAATDIDVPTLSDIERNRQAVHPVLGIRLANALETTLGQLLGDTTVRSGIEVCQYCSCSYHPMPRWSGPDGIIFVCDPEMADLTGSDGRCTAKAKADGYRRRDDLTPSR